MLRTPDAADDATALIGKDTAATLMATLSPDVEMPLGELAESLAIAVGVAGDLRPPNIAGLPPHRASLRPTSAKSGLVVFDASGAVLARQIYLNSEDAITLMGQLPSPTEHLALT